MKLCVIYIPGIRDDLGRVQGLLIQSWRQRGVRPVMHAVPWAGREDYDPKFERLLAVIDKHRAAGYSVGLVGASAGATAALQAFVARRDDVCGAVFICGKINNPHPPGSQIYSYNPAYQTSLSQMADTVKKLSPKDKQRLLSLYSPIDETVPPADSRIPGVRYEALAPRAHGRAILHTISFGAGRPLSFLKAQAK